MIRPRPRPPTHVYMSTQCTHIRVGAVFTSKRSDIHDQRTRIQWYLHNREETLDCTLHVDAYIHTRMHMTANLCVLVIERMQLQQYNISPQTHSFLNARCKSIHRKNQANVKRQTSKTNKHTFITNRRRLRATHTSFGGSNRVPPFSMAAFAVEYL